jgi:hypothetical protein
MARLSKAQEKARDKLLAAIQLESVKQNIEIPKTGKNINIKKALDLLGLTERFSLNAFVLQCAGDKVTAEKLKVKQKAELDALLVADGRPPLDPVVEGKHRKGVTSTAISVGHFTADIRSKIKDADLVKSTIEAVQKLLKDNDLGPLIYASDGSIIGLLEAGKDLGIVDRYPYLCKLARRAEKCTDAYEEVERLRARLGLSPLRISSDGSVLGLVEAAIELDIVDRFPYLSMLARKKEGCTEAYVEVERLRARLGLSPLRISSNGSVLGLVEAAIELDIVDRYPYLCKLARQKEGCNDAYEEVERLRAARSLSSLRISSNGSVLGLLEAAEDLGIVDRFSYLSMLARKKEGCNDAYEEVANLLAENDMPQLEVSSTGAMIGLLSTALFFDVVHKHAYFRTLLAKSNATAIARAVMVEEAGKRFAQFGTDPFLSAEVKKVEVAGVIATHLPNVLDPSLPQPLFQVFETCDGRIKTEAQAQFTYEHCVIETVDDKPILAAMKEFNFWKVYESSNPFNAFAVEEEFHKQLIFHGSVYPTERMFRRAGAGGFNPKHHYPGKMYGVYLLSHNYGIPPSWKLKEKYREVRIGQKRPRQEEEEQVIVG